jgi:hypothetical protein
VNSDGRCAARQRIGHGVAATVLHLDDELAGESFRAAWADHAPRQAGVPR